MLMAVRVEVIIFVRNL